MDILEYLSRTRNVRIFSVSIIVILILVGMASNLGSFFVVDEVQAEEEAQSEVFSEVRSGYYNIAEYGNEFYIEGYKSTDYFGQSMVTMDWNGDGVEDLVVTGCYWYYQFSTNYGRVYIFDGTKAIRPSTMRMTSTDADWILFSTNTTYYIDFASCLAVGDVNGDGYDDLLVSEKARSSYRGNAYLYYGGPDWDADRGTFDQSNADVKFTHTASSSYFARSLGLGDLDGDGYDDIAITSPYYRANDKYGICYVWFGNDSLPETLTHSTANFTFQSSLGYRSGYYNRIGTGPVQFGDMDGDGREELVLSGAYGYGSSSSYSGGVYVIHPKDNIRSVGRKMYSGQSTYADVTQYYGGGSYYLGVQTRVGDINGDGLADLATSSARGGTNNGLTFVVLGSATYPTGLVPIYSSSYYDFRFQPKSSSSYYSSLEMGDWDGDGTDDLAIGAPIGSSCKIYIFGGSYFNGIGGSLDLDENAIPQTLVTIGGPTYSGSNHLCSSGSYSYYYTTLDTMVFWNRDDPDPAEDLFFSNWNHYVGGSSGFGAVYGISNQDIIGKPQVRQLNGELPDSKTFYVGRQSYDFSASVMNRWEPLYSTLDIKMIMGDYEVDLHLRGNGTFSIEGDDLGWLDPDYDSFNTIIDGPSSMVFWTWSLGFTLNVTFDGYIDLIVDNGMMAYTLEGFAYLKSRFLFTGDLEAWVGGDPETRFYDGKEHRMLMDGETVPEDTDIIFTGIGLIYEGTENFMSDFEVEPFYPKQEYFYFQAENVHGQIVSDYSSMGRDFILPLNTGGMPVKVAFDFKLGDLPGTMVVNELPGFHVYVDNDIPMAPGGLMVHADSFTDTNSLVDNDGELFVTWYEPLEIFSGVRYYEVMADGMDDTMITTNTFLQIDTEAEGVVEVSVRAYDMVGHIGEYTTASINIDYEGLEFSDYYPGPTEWSNIPNPEIGITITDIGGMSIVGDSVEYAISGDGNDTYGSWISANYMLNAQTVTIEVAPTLMEGVGNFVKFRAKDAAGNQMESEPMPVLIDLSEVDFSEVLVSGLAEWEGLWFETGDVSITIDILDDLSGVDPATVQYRLSTRGRANLNSESWETVETTAGEGNVSVDLDLELVYGDGNFIQFRAKDLVGNPTAYSDVHNIWVNTQPIAVIDAPVNGLNVMEGSLIAFDASSSYDIDGDLITVSWNETWTDVDGVEMSVELGADAVDPLKFDVILEPGTHLITLTVSDGLHEIMTEPIKVTVTAIEDRDWLSDEDSDGDGMPNNYEYLYHLGWDDASNGGLVLNENNDFDGDKHTDLEEYNEGTNPTDTTDFPRYDIEGSDPEEPNMTLYIILIVLACLVLLTMIVLIMFNSIAIKKRLEGQEIKDAEIEKQDIERALSSGGREKLEALKAVSEGRRVASLPSAAAAVSAYQTLPTAEGVVDQAEGAAPAPAPIQPEPMQAAEPAGAPEQAWAAAPPVGGEPAQPLNQDVEPAGQNPLNGEN